MEAISEAASSARIPATLGRYDLLGTLGQGGMANVYLARLSGSAGFQRLFAIKVLHPHLAAEEAFVQMLLDEARIAARIHHPNVVPIVDLGEQAGFHFVVMEYVEGFALSSLLKKSPEQRPPRLILPLVLDALAGLHAAHTLTDDEGNALNLVHRDVSPQNLLIGTDGIARVIDFGIAKAEARINSTRPGELKGKLSFMSPEQLRSPELVDFRSDIFSAGVMLWSALTGRQMFLGGSSAATLNNILRMEIVAPSTVGLMPPEWLDEVCLKALARDPAERTASALEMEEDLRQRAVSHDALGNRREIADWVRTSFAQELSARRDLVRRSVARTQGLGHASGTMPISAWQGHVTEGSYSGREVTLTPSRLTAAGAAREADCEVVVNEVGSPGQAPTPSHRKRWLVVSLLAVCGAIGGLYMIRTRHAPDGPAPPVTSELSTVAPPPPTPTPVAVPPAPVAAAPSVVAGPREAVATAPPSKARASRARIEYAPPKPAAHAPVEPVAPSPPTKRTTAWDSDSSLPPP